MQSAPKFTGNYLICTHLKSQNYLKSLNVKHLRTRQVFQKKRYPKKAEGGGGGGSHIDPTLGEIGLSLCGNIKVKETTTITFTNLGQNFKVY